MMIVHRGPFVVVVILTEHETIPPKWAHEPAAEIWREVAIDTPAGRNVLVKALGEVQ